MAEMEESDNNGVNRNSSSYRLKKSLMRKAFDKALYDKGECKYSPPEMIAMIMERTRRANDIPAEHVAALHDIDDEEPRSIRALNLLEIKNAQDEAEMSPDGVSRPHTQWTGKVKGPTLH